MPSLEEVILAETRACRDLVARSADAAVEAHAEMQVKFEELRGELRGLNLRVLHLETEHGFIREAQKSQTDLTVESLQMQLADAKRRASDASRLVRDNRTFWMRYGITLLIGALGSVIMYAATKALELTVWHH